jgi:hypothetical protein
MGAGVRITLGVPRQLPPGRWRWPHLAEAAPKPWYFRAGPERFTAAYLAQLNRFADDIDRKLAWLADAYPDQPITLLCFDRRVGDGGTFCHRLLFSRWWTERTGQPVPELDPR